MAFLTILQYLLDLLYVEGILVDRSYYERTTKKYVSSLTFDNDTLFTLERTGPQMPEQFPVVIALPQV